MILHFNCFINLYNLRQSIPYAEIIYVTRPLDIEGKWKWFESKNASCSGMNLFQTYKKKPPMKRWQYEIENQTLPLFTLTSSSDKVKVFSSFGAFQLNIGLQFMESGSLERLLSASVELHFTKKKNKQKQIKE